MRFVFTSIILIALSLSSTFAQTFDKQELDRMAREKESEYQIKRAETIEKAREIGIPVRSVLPDGRTIELIGFYEERPVFYTTNNLRAAETISTDHVWPGGSAGLSLTGSGITLGEWDAGRVRMEHQELVGRVTMGDNSPNNHNHSTHVAGTMIAAGVVADAKGMSYEASLEAYDWKNDLSEMISASANGMRVSNHSYGIVHGWHWNAFNDGKWLWAGYSEISETEDAGFGFYNSRSRAWDNAVYNSPYYLICIAAGNDRNDRPRSQPVQHWVYDQSSNSYTLSNQVRDKDGGDDGYDCLGQRGVAKNVLTVGAAYPIDGGYTQPSDVRISGFSSWGPTDDGRIKPDLCADGVRVYSCLATSNDAYANYSGTSMATPNLAGSIGLLIQHHKNLYGHDRLWASTMKGILIHTADEAGDSDGPDYEHGWGLANIRKAAELMSDNKNYADGFRFRELTLNNQDSKEIFLLKSDNESARTTICWTDPAVSERPHQPSSLNDRTKMLVNDLDMTISHGDTEYYPWILDPDNPADPAEKTDNDLDNVEQIDLKNPDKGLYIVKIDHEGSLNNNYQNYSLMISGFEPVAPPALISPADMADDTETDVAFEWESVKLADEYRIQISEANDFENVDHEYIISENSATISLKNLQKYNWRVRAVYNGGEGPWSDVYEFSTKGNPPALTYPADGATDVEHEIDFDWADISGEINYRIQVASDPGFASIIHEFGDIDNSQRRIAGFDNLGLYYWRVRAENQNGTGEWSDIYSFTTICPPPELISPGSGAIAVEIEPQLIWSQLEGNLTYTVEISTDDSFADAEFVHLGLETTTLFAPDLEYYATYYWRVRAENQNGTGEWSESWDFMTTPSEPEISEQSEGAIICRGESIQLDIIASGEVVQYQWQKDGEDIEGETTPILALDNADHDASANYRCRLTNPPGDDIVYSDGITIYVATNTEFTEPPTDQYVEEGGNAVFKFKAHVRGLPPEYQPEIQWYRGNMQLSNNDRIEGVKSNILTIKDVRQSDLDDNYWAMLKGYCGDVVESERIGLYSPGADITAQPTDADVCTGDQAMFVINAEPANGATELKYQWTKDGSPLSDGSNISGSQTNTLTIDPVYAADAGEYQAEITIIPGNKTITSDVATLAYQTPPEFTTDLLDNYSVDEGKELTLSVEADGTEPIDYQWFKDSAPISGAVSATFTKTMQMGDAGVYYCLATNECGQTQSNEANITVTKTSVLSVSEGRKPYQLRNVPNPFAGTTTIRFNLENISDATLSVSDMMGRSVAILHEGQLGAGEYSFAFDPSEYNLTAGVYLYILNIDGHYTTGRMVLVR
jgi:hypothetical protein